jgi:hypothetical protein
VQVDACYTVQNVHELKRFPSDHRRLGLRLQPSSGEETPDGLLINIGAQRPQVESK